MREYLVTVLLAAIITYLITPLVRDLAIKSGAVAAIRSRDVHREPTPRWGGLSMWFAMALTLVIANYLPLINKSFGSEDFFEKHEKTLQFSGQKSDHSRKIYSLCNGIWPD